MPEKCDAIKEQREFKIVTEYGDYGIDEMTPEDANKLFNQVSPHKIIKRLCKDCQSETKEIYYKRTQPGFWDAFGAVKQIPRHCLHVCCCGCTTHMCSRACNIAVVLLRSTMRLEVRRGGDMGSPGIWKLQ